MKISVHFSARKLKGGEDIAISRFVNALPQAQLFVYTRTRLNFLSMFLNLRYLFSVINNRGLHIIINHDFQISLLTVFIASLFGAQQRYYIHNFYVSCPVGTHYSALGRCYECRVNKIRAGKRKCCRSTMRLLYGIYRSYVYFPIFAKLPNTKFYFVSGWQKSCALDFMTVEKNDKRYLVIGNYLF
jgi:hypothetical protein